MSFFGLDDRQLYPFFHLSSHYSFSCALTYRPFQLGFVFLLELYFISSASTPFLVHLHLCSCGPLVLWSCGPVVLWSANGYPPKLAILRQQTHDLGINGSLGE